ncbi:MAG: signal recognition particle-docking protein FtsY [Christensenellaceae bacterium]|jgi:fused signal recognition particle receptor|nr:signal recognition particle-docking protein FtsY [Christensenellaceae bacterium]
MGLFSRIKDALIKTKENIGRKLFETFKGRALDDAFYEDLEMALISADVGVMATETILDELRQAAYKKKLTDTESAKNELRSIMVGIVDFDILPFRYPLVIMLAGVNGVGKTTAIGKLAKYFLSIGKSVIVAAADTFRAAASEQLEVWAQRAGVRIIKHSEGSDPAAVVYDAISSAKAKNTDVVLVDTAGRLHNKKNLMEELKKIGRVVTREAPNSEVRNYLVLDATTGQNAISQVEFFDEAIEIDGIVLTKLDSSAKGGVVMAIAEELKIPVVFVGIGETIDDLIPFDATDFIDGIL